MLSDDATTPTSMEIESADLENDFADLAAAVREHGIDALAHIELSGQTPEEFAADLLATYADPNEAL